MIEFEALVEILREKAQGYINYDNAYPDVGMGLGYDTAIDMAQEAVYKEAARWNSIEALGLQFTPELRKEVYRRLR